MTYKTVLAPGAPWPSYEAPPKPKAKPKKRAPSPLKGTSRIRHTDEKFKEWAAKNLGGVL